VRASHASPVPSEGNRANAPKLSPVASSPVVLTIDLGTSVCKATLFDARGGVVRRVARALNTRRGPHGEAEHDAREWLDAASRAGCEAAAGTAPAAIALTSFRETVALCDDAGAPLAPALLWSDPRGEAEARAFAVAFPDAHARTGLRPNAQFTAAKLAWMSANAPDAVRSARWVLQPRDFLLRHLTGVAATDPTLASRTLMWSRGGGWWEDAISFARVRADQLPPVLAPHAVAGPLAREAAAALGVREGVPVVVGAGDRACEALAVSAVAGRAMISLGTAVNVSTMVPAVPGAPPSDRVLFSGAAIEGFEVLEQGIPAGSSLVAWLCGVLGIEVEDALELAARTPIGSDGARLLPFFGGARATRWNSGASGAWSGLGLATTRGALVRSALEGVGFEIRAALRVLRDAGAPIDTIVPVGGPARSALWPGIIGEIAATPRATVRDTEAASMGAFLLAGRALGWWEDALAAANVCNADVSRDAPDAVRCAAYARIAESYEALYEALSPWYARYGATP
jgi:xylulokinase